MNKKNPWATEYGRPRPEKDVDGEWNDEEGKLYDRWERENNNAIINKPIKAKEIVMPVLPITVTAFNGKRYTIKQAPTTGGRTARLNNRTSSLTIIHDGESVKRLPYLVQEPESKYGAISRALIFCLGKTEAKNFLSRQTVSQ